MAGLKALQQGPQKPVPSQDMRRAWATGRPMARLQLSTGDQTTTRQHMVRILRLIR